MRTLRLHSFLRTSTEAALLSGAEKAAFVLALVALLALNLTFFEWHVSPESGPTKPASPIRHPVATPSHSSSRDTSRAQAGEAHASDALARISLPWSQILDGLGRAKPKGVYLLEMEPAVGANTVRVVVESAKVSSLFEYIDRLKSMAPYVEVRPARIEEVEINGEATTRMTLLARWEIVK